MKNSTRINRAIAAKKKFFLFLTFLTLSIGQMWGAKHSMTPDQSTTGSSSTSYVTTLTDFSHANPTGSSIGWKINQWNPSSLQVKTNQSSASSEFRFYNTSAFAGKITKVVMTFSALTLSNTTTTGFQFLGGSKEVTSTSGGTNGTWNSSSKTITWTPAAITNYTYFAFYQNGKVATGINKLATSNAIVVYYLTKVTLDKNAGTDDGVIYFDDNATAASTATGYTFSAATRAGHTCTGYYTASSGGTKVLNANGTFANANVSGYVTGSKWIYAGGTLKLYAQWEAAAATPTITPSVTQLDWGIVNKGASLSNKTFTITGSNLTAANLVYSGNGGYTVSPEGKTGAAGSLASQTITVTPPSTATPGTYNSTVSISGGGLSSAVTVAVKLTVQNTDQFIDELHNTTGYTSANPHIEAGSYGTTPTIADKAVATSGTCAQQHYHFVGWITAAKYEAGTAIDAGDLQTPTSATGATYYAVWAKQAAGGGSDVTDVINNAATTDALGSTGTSSWADNFTVIGSNSTAVYSIHSMGINGASNYALQWNKNAYLYTSTAPKSGLKLKSITITTLAAKSIALYASISAYSAKATASSLGDNMSAGTSGTTYTLTSAQLANNYTCVGINGTESSTQIVSISITYSGGVSYEDYIAKCCTELGSINGSVSETHQRSLTLQWDKLSGVDGTTPYTITCKQGSDDAGTIGDVDLSGAKATCTVTGLACGTTYTFTITAHGDATHCDKTQENIQGTTSAAMTLPTLTYATGLTAGGANITPSWASAVSHDGSVTYVSSNPSVVQIVNASTGEAKPVGAGEATITATYAQSTNNCEASKTSNTISVTGNVSVSFNANGGGGTMTNQSIQVSTPTELKENEFTAPSSCQYFYGWATSKENADAGTRAYENGQSVTINAGMELFAIWKTYNYTVTEGTNEGAATFTLPANVDCGGTISITCAADGTHKGNPTITATEGKYSAINVLSATSAEITGVSGNITVNISYAAKENYSITWKVNDAPYAPHQEEEDGKVNGDALVYEGNTIATLPTAPADNTLGCANKFMGWSTHDYKSVKKAASDYDDLFTTASGAPEIEGATTFYAVFATATSGTSGWIETAIGDLASSDVFVLSNGEYAVNNTNGDKGPGMTEITVTEGVITDPATIPDEIKWHITGNATDGFTFYPAGDNTNYLYCNTVATTKSNDNIKIGTQNSNIRNTWKLTNDNYLLSEWTVTTDGDADRYLSFNGTTDVRSYLNTNTTPIDVHCYKYGSTATISDYVTECAAVEAPTFSPAAGEYHEAKDVTISCATVGYDEIRYTTDGTDPTKTTGTVYGSAITVDETTTIKAIAVKGDNVSDVVSATYTITYPRTVTFNAGTGTAGEESLTEASYGAGITLPSATPSTYCVAEGWEFAGWATTNSTTTAPTIVSGTYTPESDITLYAVYKLGDENYHLVTELPTGEDIPGDYMIVNTANTKAMDAYVKSTYYLDEDATGTITDNTIIPANVTYFNYNHWTVTYESSKWIFYNEYQKKYLYNYCNDGTHHNVGITESKPSGYTIALSDGFAVFTSADDAGAHIWYDAAHSDFAGTTETTNNLHLYKQATATYSSIPACCDDEVTVSKADNPSTGTFTLDKSGVLSTCAGSQVVTVTCVPNAGYHVDEVAETIETGVTIEEIAENVYTVTYAKNVSGASTISVTFAETLDPSFQISQNAFEIGDVAVGETVQRQFNVSAVHLEGTSLSISSSNDKFSVSPTSLTIKADGSVDEATVTVTLNTTAVDGPYSATITLADGATTPNTATVNLTNATIKNQYNVKWYNGTDLLSEANYLDGATISVIPTAASCDPSISHVGWLPNATIDGKQADAPAGLVANEDIPAVTADVEYHAVFAKVGEASWRSTDLADLTSEDIFVIAETSAKHALTSDNGTGKPVAASITISDGKLTSDVTNAIKWNLSGNATDGYTFYPNGSTETWLYCTNANDGLKVGTGENNLFEIKSAYLYNKGTSRYVGVYNNADWRCYTSTGTNINDQTFAFYKYIAPVVKDYMTTCAVTFSATYEAGGGTGDDYVDPNLIEKNADYTVLGNDVTGFMKTDYRFNGWKCGDDDYAAGATYENVTADLTFVAQWIEKEEAGLEYETSAYEVIQNGSFAKPTLTNPHDLAVTYSSSNESVATVDAEGNVTLKADAIGTTVITATSEATDTYKAGEASYTLNVASKWALTYTSNVALVENSDTKASSATVNSYDAMKCGTTSVDGAMEITVPKNTEKLHIHAVGWKDANVTISITGATASPSSIVLTADNAISGNGSSFTLSKPSTFYKEITLSNITEATTLTLTATSGKRFVVYGVNEESGIWELPSDDADESDIPSEVNVVVSENQSLTINNAKTLDNLIVEAGGKVTGSATLNVQDLTINTQSGKSGQVTGSNVSVNGDIYLEIKLDASGSMDPTKYYCISAPFDVNMNGGFFWGNGDQMGLNQDFQLFEYQGSKRASTGNGWQRVSGTMKKNTAYFIGFDDENTNNQNVIRLKAANKNLLTDATIELQGHEATYGQDATEIAKNSNWNGLGNPRLHYVDLNKTVSIYEPSTVSFQPYDAESANGFVVGTAFFVHGTGDLSFANTHHGTYRAPKREGERYSYCVEIAKENASSYDNRLYVKASETASTSFEEGVDLPTLNNETSKYGALIWTKNYGMRLAIEETPLVNSLASYELGIYAPANGSYVISVAEAKDNADLYLTYEGSIIWNLSMGEYELDLNKGTTNGYGLLLQAKAPQVVTGVDEVQSDKVQCTKVVIDDHVYILRGGQMYDVTGKMVK